MKKLLALALTGVLAAAALAVESEPSNTVGFISRAVTSGAYAAFSACPMGLGTDVPASTVLGGQGANGDRIIRFAGAWNTAPWTPDGTWSGLTLDYNGWYMYRNGHGADGTLVVAGDVIPEGTSFLMKSFVAGYTGFGNPLPMVIDLDTDDLGLDAAGFEYGDKIYRFAGSWNTMTYTPENGYFGLVMEPGGAYLFRTANAFDWNYTVPSGALAVSNAPVKVAKAAKAAVELQ